ncbi:MAG: HD domain-containing protein [Paludibacteraceae bacterium]|nr:HD domain-containing protein [Paludibacteraceae bacterium]
MILLESTKDDFDMAERIAQEVYKLGGHTYFVGGYVRDKILGKENKDIDIEVHGITPSQLMDILEKLGEPMKMGSSFGVYGLKGYDIDIAQPRKEHATGRGHKDFEVDVDPFMGTENASKRRDLTFNALMQDVITGEILDYYGGQVDIKNKKIRHVDKDTFIEDALRVLRAAQFAARNEFSVDEETIELGKTMDLKSLSAERIYGELHKALMKSNKPSIFFKELDKMNGLDYWFKELKDLQGVRQNPEHHPEGDAYVHTLMVLDKAAEVKNSSSEPFSFMLSALCHDLGKSVATDDSDESHITAYEHDSMGVPIAERLLKRLRCSNSEINYVLNMVEYHMMPNMIAKESHKQSKFNKMFSKIKHPKDILLLAKCDHQGRSRDEDYSKYEEILKNRYSQYEEDMKQPRVTAKDLIEYGVPSGQIMGQLLKRGDQLYLSRVRKEVILKELLKIYRHYTTTGEFKI